VIWRCAALGRRADVSEEPISSIITITRLWVFSSRSEDIPQDGRRRELLQRHLETHSLLVLKFEVICSSETSVLTRSTRHLIKKTNCFMMELCSCINWDVYFCYRTLKAKMNAHNISCFLVVLHISSHHDRNSFTKRLGSSWINTNWHLQTRTGADYFVPAYAYSLIETLLESRGTLIWLLQVCLTLCNLFHRSDALNTACAVAVGSLTVLTNRRGLHQTSKALGVTNRTSE
jgi:hypothetical protein